MSWIDLLLEDRLAQAARDGELDGGPLSGRPLPDLDRQRPNGWWADRFVQRELSHDRRMVAEEAARRAQAGFWRAATLGELRERVATANRDLAAANINLVAADQLDPFDVDDVTRRWRALRPR